MLFQNVVNWESWKTKVNFSPRRDMFFYETNINASYQYSGPCLFVGMYAITDYGDRIQLELTQIRQLSSEQQERIIFENGKLFIICSLWILN